MARRQTVTVRTGGAGIDSSDFKSVATALRRAAPEVARDLREELRAAGAIVAEEAKTIASQHSQTIPPTIKVRVASTTVSVVAGGADAPVAGLFELGNTGNRRKSAAASRRGTFRHPVYGNRKAWVNQDMHPYLAPAAEMTAPKFELAAVAALDKATHTIVFEK